MLSVLTTLLMVALLAPAYAADFQAGLEAYKGGSYVAALREFRPLAERGHARAQYRLGLMYLLGNGVPKDLAEAVKWYRKAAEQGHARAAFMLGLMYGSGRSVPKDLAEAVKWYRKAAEQGDPLSQNRLGGIYARGEGVPQDDAEAVKWYRKAAEQGNAEAQAWLGYMYATGRGVPKDDLGAEKWYRLAAEQGHVEAQVRLSALEAKEMWHCFGWSDHNKATPLFTLGRVRVGGKDVGGEVSVAGITHPAYFQVAGLERRWDWDYHDEGGFRYALIIEPDGTGKYYDFSASDDGRVEARQFFKCLLSP